MTTGKGQRKNVKAKAPKPVRDPNLPPTPRRARGEVPAEERSVNAGQIYEAAVALGFSGSLEGLIAEYARHGKRKVAKENDPAWLQEQLRKVTGKVVALSEPQNDHFAAEPTENYLSGN